MGDFARPCAVVSLPGLVRLSDGKPVAVTYDAARGCWRVDAGDEIADDVLTGLVLYTFGGEDHKRLVFHRPAEPGLALLARDRERTLALLREYPRRHQLFTFGIDPAAVGWSRLVRERRASYATLSADLAGVTVDAGMAGGRSPPRGAASRPPITPLYQFAKEHPHHACFSRSSTAAAGRPADGGDRRRLHRPRRAPAG